MYLELTEKIVKTGEVHEKGIDRIIFINFDNVLYISLGAGHTMIYLINGDWVAVKESYETIVYMIKSYDKERSYIKLNEFMKKWIEAKIDKYFEERTERYHRRIDAEDELRSIQRYIFDKYILEIGDKDWLNKYGVKMSDWFRQGCPSLLLPENIDKLKHGIPFDLSEDKQFSPQKIYQWFANEKGVMLDEIESVYKLRNEYKMRLSQ